MIWESQKEARALKSRYRTAWKRLENKVALLRKAKKKYEKEVKDMLSGSEDKLRKKILKIGELTSQLSTANGQIDDLKNRLAQKDS